MTSYYKYEQIKENSKDYPYQSNSSNLQIQEEISFLNLYLSFFCWLFWGKQYFSLRSFLDCDFLEVENAKSWNLGDYEKTVIGHLCNNIVGKGKPLKLLAVGQLCHFLKI